MKKDKKSKWWKYLLGLGALTIVGGVVAGGVVSCSSGSSNSSSSTTSSPTSSSNTSASSTNSNSNSSSSSTASMNVPKTTSDYKLVPQAQAGITYNENLSTSSQQDASAISMDVTSNSIAYASLQKLSTLAGLDVYVGGELAAVINPNTTNNPTLTLNLANPNLSAEELSKAGSLLTVRPTLTNYQITYTGVVGNNGKASNQPIPANTPVQLAVMSDTQENDGLLEWGSGNSPLGAWFGIYCPHNQFNDGNYIYGVADFSVLPNGKLNFTTVNAGFTFSYVDNGKTVNETLNINVDLTPFYLGTATEIKPGTLTSEMIDSNKLIYDAYMKADDYSKPLVLDMPTPTITQYKIDPTFIIWNGVYYPIMTNLPNNFVDVPFTPIVKDGKITGWTAPTIYAYFVNSTNNGVYQANFDLFNASTVDGLLGQN